MARLSWDERCKRRKAKRDNLAKERANNRLKSLTITRKLAAKLLKIVENSGFNRIKLAQYSGVSPASVSRLTLRRHIDTIRFSAVIGLARACGYKIEFVRLSPEEDDFFDDRWLKASEFYSEKSDKQPENPEK